MVRGQHAHRVWEKGGQETSSPKILKRMGQRLGGSRTAQHPLWWLERSWRGAGIFRCISRVGHKGAGEAHWKGDEGLRPVEANVTGPQNSALHNSFVGWGLSFRQMGVLFEVTVALSRGEMENECGHFWTPPCAASMLSLRVSAWCARRSGRRAQEHGKHRQRGCVQHICVCVWYLCAYAW